MRSPASSVCARSRRSRRAERRRWRARSQPQAPTDRRSARGRAERVAALERALASRILVLDGAMGTMIQDHGLAEADYRGARFADHAAPQKGNNDLLSLTQPAIVRDIHAAYLAAGSGHRRDQHLQLDRHCDVRLPDGGRGLRPQLRLRPDRARRGGRADRSSPRNGRASSPGFSARPTGPPPSLRMSTIRGRGTSTSRPSRPPTGRLRPAWWMAESMSC